MKKLTAIYTTYEGMKNQVMVREDYSTKKAFMQDLKSNGYRNIRIHTEEDFAAMHKGFKSASDMEKYNKAMDTIMEGNEMEIKYSVEPTATVEANPAANKSTKNLEPVLTELHKAFKLMNNHFFEGKLTEVVIAIQAKGKSNALGWYTPYPSWAEGDDTKQEITITAEHLNRDYIDILRTLLHECIHHYCHLNDIQETSRQGKYHNKKFKEESEKRGFHYPTGKPDTKIGWSFSELTEETIALFQSWPIDKEVFGLARIDYASGKEKKKKKSNIIKWTCPSCGCTMRSSKLIGVKPYCMNDLEADGETVKEPCAAYFEPEIPEGFIGKTGNDDDKDEDAA